MKVVKPISHQLNTATAQADFDLPEGWALARIGDTLEVKYGKGLKKANRISGSVPVYGSNGVVGQHNIGLTQGSTIVIGRKGTVGAVHFSNVPCWPIDTTYFIDEFNGLAPRYLVYALQRLNLPELDTSSAIPGLNRDKLYSQKIRLAPLSEQKRIVAKVEQLLARVNTLRERLAKVPGILKRFRQAVLAAACSGRLTEDWRYKHPNLESAQQLIQRVFARRREQYMTESQKLKTGHRKSSNEPASLKARKVEGDELPEIPDKWAWVYLPDLGYMSRGKSRYRPRNAPHLYGGSYPFIQTGDIAQSRGQISFHRQTYSEDGLAQSRIWPSGTVCITIAANIASSAILTYPACFPDSVVGLIPDADFCLAEYAEFFIRTAQADLDQFAPATSQKNINIGILSKVALPLPPFAEQQEIIRRVEALFKLASTIEKRVVAAAVRAERLTQAILAKAFRGELVPTEAELARREGRPYESASALLGKIEGQRIGVNLHRDSRQKNDKQL
ncbi:MAG: restriction endonuclease subunit S [Candidatus Subteraquimicrobiales bacterium]|nr:restriction endonuclease subunit S [Candidatus Subteraquimicrobiales bacterium]